MEKTGNRIKKGSFTLEAAVIIPLTAGFFAVILMFFRILQIEMQVQSCLIYAGRITAVQADDENEDWMLACATATFYKSIAEHAIIEQYVKGGRKGISLASSKASGNYVILEADYLIKIPVGFFHINSFSISQSCISRKWTGSEAGKDIKEENWVYVTPEGSVYHRKKTCTYLDLSIKSCTVAQVGGRRNKSGQKYRVCIQCADQNTGISWVYITDYGECYHADPACSGLKRTVYHIPLSETEGRRPCSKCGK